MAPNSQDSYAPSKTDNKGGSTRSKEETEKILLEAKKRFKLCEEAERDTRALSREDFEFRSGKQWRDQDIVDRQIDGRPCLVINRMPQFIQQVTNDQRQNRSSIKVHPEDDEASKETAEIIEDATRHIENASNADVATDTAFDAAATGGFGFFAIGTKYVDHRSFLQEIVFRRLLNPNAAYLDPSHEQPDGSDSNYGFIYEDLQEDDFKTQYPKAELTSMREWESLGTESPDWITAKTARVVEYYRKEWVDDELLELSDGSAILASEYVEPEAPEMAEPMDGAPEAMASQAPVIVARRATQIPKVCCYLINGIEILDETEFPSEWIPIVPVYGSEYVVNGKIVREGVIRHAKDSQRMYNYWASTETETIALAPRTPWVGAEGQFDGHEEKWAMINRRNLAFIEYKPTTVAGQLAPPPQRQAFEPPVQAVTQAKAMAADDMKATTGEYDAALGARSNENSGVAIQRRANQAQTANFHLIDNLNTSRKHAGRIIASMIPKVYDTSRRLPTVNSEGVRKMVMVNAPFIEAGKSMHFDLTRGRYGCTIDIGPSFATKRQESAAAMMELAGKIPVIGQAAPDLLVKSLDMPGAHTLAERLKKTLPPGLAEDDQNGQAPQVPPQIQAKLQQYGQMLEQLTKTVHDQAQVIETKKMELESKERIETLKIQSNAEIELAKLGSKEGLALLGHQIAQIESRLNLLNFSEPPPFSSDSSDPTAAGAPSPGQLEGQPPTGGESPGMPEPMSPGPSME